jgi:hypothetical protein
MEMVVPESKMETKLSIVNFRVAQMGKVAMAKSTGWISTCQTLISSGITSTSTTTTGVFQGTISSCTKVRLCKNALSSVMAIQLVRRLSMEMENQAQKKSFDKYDCYL